MPRTGEPVRTTRFTHAVVALLALPSFVLAGPGATGQAIQQMFQAPVVVQTTPTDGQLLTYNGAARQWRAAAAAGVSSLAGTPNQVTITGVGALTASLPATVVLPGTLTTGGLVTFADGNNLAVGTTTGTQIATATTQKIAFYGATPVVQISGATDVLAGLATLGLRAASANPPLNLGTGAVTAGTGTFSGALSSGAAAGTTGSLKLLGTTSGTCTITVPAVAGTPTFTLPAAVGAAGQVLTDAAGTGVLSWTTISAGVTSVTGTTNQVTASPTTGAVVLTLPATIVCPGTISAPGAGASSERFGAGATAAGASSVALGGSATCPYASSVVIGQGATTASSLSVTIGQGATGGNQCTVVGQGTSANGALFCVVLGGQNNSNSRQNCVAIGYGSSPGFDNCIVLGVNAAAAAANQLVLGSNGTPISNAYIGKGVTNATPAAVTLQATGGSGAGVAGVLFTINGTVAGDAATTGGAVAIATAKAGAGQTLVERLRWTADGAEDYTGIATGSAPALSAAGHGRLYYDSTLNSYMLSANGGAYAALAAGGVTSVTGTTNQVTASPTTGAVVLTLPATVVCPGTISAPGGTNSERFGASATAAGSNNVAVGQGAIAGSGNNNVAVGQGATCGAGAGWNTVVGTTAAATAQGNTLFGYLALSNSNYATAVGYGTTANGVGATAVGSWDGVRLTLCNFLGSVAIGAGAQATASSQLVIGSSTLNYGITQVVIGGGVSAGSPIATVTYTTTNGSGAGVTGTNMVFQGSLAGDAATAGGYLEFQTAPAGSGQTPAARLRITPAGLLAIGGVSASFPALKRVTTSVAFRLADDSADAPITAAAGTFSGALSSGVAGTTGSLKLLGTTSGTCTITVPAVAGTPTFTLPAAIGSAGQVLTDVSGTGVLSWATPAAGGVSSVTGTTNQITASPTTGAVVLTLPATIVCPGTISVPGAGAGSERFGAGSIAAGALATAIGPYSSGFGVNSVALGYSASGSASGAVALGTGANASGVGAVSIGLNAVAAYTSTAIGNASTATKNNQFISGSATQAITEVLFGNGATSGTPQATTTVTTTNGSGTNITGTTLALAGGLGTGTGASGDCALQTGYKLTTGTTVQTLGDRLRAAGKVTALSLTSATATNFVQLEVPTSNSSGGCQVFYTIEANDGTNWNTASGAFSVAASNKAGTVTATATAISLEATNANSGTLTAGNTAVAVSGTSVQIKVTPVWTVIVPTTVQISYTVIAFGNGTTVTPQ